MKLFSYILGGGVLLFFLAACNRNQYVQQEEYDDLYRSVSTHKNTQSNTSISFSESYTSNTVVDDYYGSSAKTVNPEYIENYASTSAVKAESATYDTYSSQDYYVETYDDENCCNDKNVTVNNNYYGGYSGMGGCSTCGYSSGPNVSISMGWSNYWGPAWGMGWQVGWSNYNSCFYDPWYYPTYVYNPYYRYPYYAHYPYRRAYHQGYYHGYYEAAHHASPYYSSTSSITRYGPRSSRGSTVGVSRTPSQSYEGRASGMYGRYEESRKKNQSGARVTRDSRDFSQAQETYYTRSRRNDTHPGIPSGKNVSQQTHKPKISSGTSTHSRSRKGTERKSYPAPTQKSNINSNNRKSNSVTSPSRKGASYNQRGGSPVSKSVNRSNSNTVSKTRSSGGSISRSRRGR